MSNTDFGDLEVYFPTTGVRILPYSVDYKVQQQKLEYSKLKVSRAAGELIASKIEADPIPAVLSINGSDLCRLAADEESVRHVGDISWVDLRDPRAVLENGHIQWEPAETTLGEAVEYIYERTADPNGVLTGVEVVGEIERAETEREYISKFQRWIDQRYPEWIKGKRNPFNGKPLLVTERLSGGFRFRGATPLEAISEIQSTFAVESWVTTEGVLTLGLPGEKANVGVVGEDPRDLRLADYNIVDQAVPVSAIQANGIYTDNYRAEFGPIDYVGGMTDFSVRSVATYAQEGRSRILELEPRNISGYKELEQVALNELRRRISEGTSGSLTINSAVSGGSDVEPQDLDLGDIIMIPEIDRDCHKTVHPGIYIVTGMNHRVSAREGWLTYVDVAEFVTEDEITVSSKIRAPGSEEWIDADQFAKETLYED